MDIEEVIVLKERRLVDNFYKVDLAAIFKDGEFLLRQDISDRFDNTVELEVYTVYNDVDGLLMGFENYDYRVAQFHVECSDEHLKKCN